MDALSDVLENLRLRSRILAETELCAPWGIRANPSGDFAFHIVSRGRCWFEVDGEPPVEVRAPGTCCCWRRAEASTLRDDPTSDAQRFR